MVAVISVAKSSAKKYCNAMLFHLTAKNVGPCVTAADNVG